MCYQMNTGLHVVWETYRKKLAKRKNEYFKT